MRVGLEIAAVLQKKYPEHFDVTKTITLLGNDSAVQQLKAGIAPEQIISGWAPDLGAFEQVRRKYFLYK
jgi:uncharacterized protein YbbC (DUF1343 family)